LGTQGPHTNPFKNPNGASHGATSTVRSRDVVERLQRSEKRGARIRYPGCAALALLALTTLGYGVKRRWGLGACHASEPKAIVGCSSIAGRVEGWSRRC